MIIPRQWVPRHNKDYGLARIAQAFADSKPPSNPKVMGIFWLRSKAARRSAGRRGSASGMAMKFAAKFAASVK